MTELQEIDQSQAEAERELANLDARRSELLSRIEELKQARISMSAPLKYSTKSTLESIITAQSSQEEKIGLFRSLFRGREDVYPRRFENLKTGKNGYQPVCRNEWVSGICEKPRVRCVVCPHRQFIPVTDDVIRYHLLGVNPQERSKRDFTIGVYPMLLDEACWFLAVDFDKTSWQDDARAFCNTCKDFSVPAALERSRSGNGGHIWIFFYEPISAILARKLGTFLLTRTMENRPEIGLESYDRFFPSQDTLPKGGFGNLIALPLQKKPRENGNSLFVDENFTPHHDQWAFLSSIEKITQTGVEALVATAENKGELMSVRIPITNEDEDRPWEILPSRKQKEPPILGPFPSSINIVLGNQIYVPTIDLPPSLRNRLIRLAAFQNPEFYQAQRMRFSTFGKPRVISCCEYFPKHLALPRGCLDELLKLVASLNIKVNLTDERFSGTPLEIQFHGELRPEQKLATNALLAHETGVLSASTAFGKTVLAAYLIAQRKTNTLIIVHRRQLLDQWVSTLIEFLGVEPKQIGQIGGGKRKPTGIIDVAMIQTLNRKGVVDDIVGQYGHLIVDECHHISAVSFEQVVRQSKARYITGLSATVVRKDGHHPIIFMQCGPVRYKVDDRKQAESRPFDHKVVICSTKFRPPAYIQDASALSIQELYTLLSKDDKRNSMIVDDIVRAVSLNRNPVVLTERREHVAVLSNLLTERIQNVFAMAGGMGKKQRKQLMEQITAVPANEQRVIVATGRYLGEGFDDARLDTLFLTLPISWRGRLTQYAGRLHRLNAAKKEVIIYDYVDFEMPVLVRMYTKRRSGYKSIGYEITLPEPKDKENQLTLGDI
ncbi:MAG: DEAD/DEAH box helicase [Anaerolineaceae bacterium]|nr:DEAD/DEAH box helicase [Anaerolineaceae bacterium]